MKAIEQYQCEVCETVFPTKTNAEYCEKQHITKHELDCIYSAQNQTPRTINFIYKDMNGRSQTISYVRANNY